MTSGLMRDLNSRAVTTIAGACLAFLLATANASADQVRPSQPNTVPAAPRSARTLPPPRLNTPFYAAMSWSGEIVGNLTGGLKTGATEDSLLHIGFAANSDALGLPPGGRFKISMIRIDSGRPSENLVGDSQVVSNIAARSATRIYQFWFRQDFAGKRFQLRAGLIDLNQYFDVLGAASDLVNSSFGITPGIAANMPTAIYPEPGFGAMARWREQGTAFSVGLFQGDPARRVSLFHNGRSIIAEWEPIGYRSGPDSPRVKIGLWQCRCDAGPSEGKVRTWGFYGSLQLPVDDTPDMTLFAHLAASPGPRSQAPFSAAFGLTMTSPLPGRAGDRLSLGITRQDIRTHSAETALEATYAAPLSNAVSLQPDLQYVFNPGGTLPDALVFMIRLHVEMTTHFQ